jgi:hypothetical protein
MQRLVLNVEPEALDSMEVMRQDGNYADYGLLIRDALQLKRAVDNQVSAGFRELIARNPKTKQENEICL